ncbi:SagB/ThcOx family dehydrogenase [Candidatus Rhodobacter oscarellae]|nr:SagB/ThcOx family dehydrogenase [Candidatus Rhodobacter lobularis]
MTLNVALTRRRSVRSYADAPVPADAIHGIAGLVLGSVTPDGKRAAPSAGGLYPLGLGVAARHVDGMEGGLYAASGDVPALRRIDDRDTLPALGEAAIGDQPWVAGCACIVTLIGDGARMAGHFADQPPKGARGARYLYIEAGAAAQNAMLYATERGVGSVLVAGFDDQATALALRVEAPEVPLLHLCLGMPEG